MRIPAGIFLPLAVFLCVAAASASAKPPAKAARKALTRPETPAALAPHNGLDTARIHQAYMDGDFDLTIDMLETARKHGGPFTHADSVFIFKHLGVMYAAKYETRELGKKNMMLLLQTEPSARIMDMYASDMIYMIFKNIQDEFEMSRAKLARAENHLRGSQASGSDAHGQEEKKPQSSKPPQEGDSASRKPRGHAWVGWTAGALAAAGGVALYYYLEDDPKSEPKVNEVR